VNALVHIDDDPVAWQLTGEQADALWAAVSQSGAPAAVDVVAPYRVRLIVSPQAAGSVALVDPSETIGWVPSDILAPSPRLYVPGHVSSAGQPAWYLLAAGTDVNALEQNLIAALRDGTTVQFELIGSSPAGRLLLNGATLSHLVVMSA
jgi:hypothetical protein